MGEAAAGLGCGVAVGTDLCVFEVAGVDLGVSAELVVGFEFSHNIPAAPTDKAAIAIATYVTTGLLVVFCGLVAVDCEGKTTVVAAEITRGALGKVASGSTFNESKAPSSKQKDKLWSS